MSEPELRPVSELRPGRRTLRRVLTVALHPALTMPGYWAATAFGLAWGGLLSRGRIERTPEGLFVAD